ncbi:MAG: lytic transglycosylase domain-containing protein [Polyangiaceae bacterium]|nr:lytic transglycosylase domain-containing protein [Polyangiaceae bacterium]
MLAFVLLTPFASEAHIYSWTDAEGVVHFSSAPQSKGAMLVAKDSKASGGPAFAPQDKDPARFSRYDEWIRQAASLYQIPVELIRAVIKVESDYDPRAISRSGARGLMQLMPDTANKLQVRDIHDPRENIFGGVRFLRTLANTFNGDLALTVAAYNAGPNAVMSAGGIPNIAETQDYVQKVSFYYRRYRMTPDAAEASMPYAKPQ